MSAVNVENIFIQSNWVCDTSSFKKAKKSILLPEDVWIIIKSYFLSSTACIYCGCNNAICLPDFKYKATLRNGLDMSLLLRQHIKITEDYIITDKHYKSAYLCFSCIKERLASGHGYLYPTNHIDTPIGVKAYYLVSGLTSMFRFFAKKNYPDETQKTSRTRLKNKLSKILLKDEDGFKSVLKILSSIFREYTAYSIKEEYGSAIQQVNSHNQRIDEIIRIIYLNEYADKYKNKAYKLIATSFVSDNLSMSKYEDLNNKVRNGFWNEFLREERGEQFLKIIKRKIWIENMEKIVEKDYKHIVNAMPVEDDDFKIWFQFKMRGLINPFIRDLRID